MGMHPLLAKGGDKKKHRWLFSVQPFIGIEISMLPPNKASRPNVSFKEYQAEHLHETINFPGKVEWQTMELSLYDIKCINNPIYDWMKRIYNPDPTSNNNRGFYGPSLSQTLGGVQFKNTAVLNLYNGCGDAIEQWVYMNAYPSKIDWGELDMQSSELTTVDLTIRYDRAYIVALNPFANRDFSQRASTDFSRTA